MQIIFNDDSISKSLKEKIRKFKCFSNNQPVFLLARPHSSVYESPYERNLFIDDLKFLVDKGLLNLEIPWEDNNKWLSLMHELKSKFPNIQIGSASIMNKKSIDDSLEIGLDFSMMRFLSKDLYLYSKKNNHILIPGLSELKDLQIAKSLKCQLIKIFPYRDKSKEIDIKKNREIFFIGAGGLSIKNLNASIDLGYQAIVIGKKGYDEKSINPQIIKWLDNYKI